MARSSAHSMTRVEPSSCLSTTDLNTTSTYSCTSRRSLATSTRSTYGAYSPSKKFKTFDDGQKTLGCPIGPDLYVWQLWRPRMVEDVDHMINAELPNPETNKLAHEMVARCMMHGPCGATFPNAPCMEDGKCKKQYPCKFQSETVTDVNGYPIYRHRDTGCTILVHGVELDNCWVVLHNVYLLTKYDAHIKYTHTCALGTGFKLVIIQLKCTLHEQTYV
jgi:hypothetical protein